MLRFLLNIVQILIFRVSADVKLFTAYEDIFDNNTNTVIWTKVTFDTCSCYDNDTGIFTAPLSGLYMFFVHFGEFVGGPIDTNDFHIVLRQTTRAENRDIFLLCAVEFCLCELNANDNVFVKGRALDHSWRDYAPRNSFSGILLRSYN